MITKPARYLSRQKRHLRIRNHISGTAARPRLAVFRSNKHIYVQAIDDVNGVTLASASTKEKEVAAKLDKTWNVEAAVLVGKTVAQKLKDKEITEVVFDRGGYIYHGKVKALAEAAREAGLQF